MRQILVCIAFGAMLPACGRQRTEEAVRELTLRGDTMVVAEGTALRQKLTVQAVEQAPYQLQTITAGSVKAIPTQYAEIAPPFPGRVLRSFVQLGRRVSAGTPLFELSSPDFMGAQKQYFQARSQHELALQTLRRQQDLMQHGVTSQKDLEEAVTAYEVAKKEYENAGASIRIFRADPDQLSLGQPLVVRSPIDGVVIDNRIVVGQFIKDDAASVATVAELSKVWVTGQVKEKDIRFIHEQDACTIELPAYPEKQITGKVYHINELVDEATRSVQVLIECSNTGRLLKPGMYVTVRFMETPVSALLIPAKAVLQVGDHSCVFLETAPGSYCRRTVTVAGSEDDRVVVAGGLQQGDRIVTEGGFFLLDANKGQ